MRLEVDEAGVAHLHVCGEGPGVARFHALLREEAAKLAALGDRASLEERMVRALGVIADRQAALDLTADSHVIQWGGPGR
ncbi:putative FHA domain containing protein [Nocardioides sp. PD653]|nr:putative FHA domain containing protein [Nocardioides sp. PD653]